MGLNLPDDYASDKIRHILDQIRHEPDLQIGCFDKAEALAEQLDGIKTQPTVHNRCLGTFILFW